MKIDNADSLATMIADCAGMRNLLTELPNTSVTALLQKLSALEKTIKSADEQRKNAEAEFLKFWNELSITPAGDGEPILNSTRHQKYLLKSLPSHF
jgi:hypothetical protein